MRISSLLGATMVAGAADPGVPAAPPVQAARRERTPRRPARRSREPRSGRPVYLQLRHRLLQR